MALLLIRDVLLFVFILYDEFCQLNQGVLVPSSVKSKKTNNHVKSVKKVYSLEIKAYAKSLFLIIDKTTSRRKFSHQEIVDKVKERCGEAPARVTFGIWAKEWEGELAQSESLLGNRDADLLKYWAGNKNCESNGQVAKALVDQIKMSLVFHSKRMHKYGELEDKIVNSLVEGQGKGPAQVKLLKKLIKTNPEADRLKNILENFKLVDIQRGVVESTKTFITHLEKLEKWIEIEQSTGQKEVVSMHQDDIWEFEPVDIEEFIENKEEFLGEISGGFYNCVVEDLKRIFYGNPRKLLERRRFKEVVFKEAFGTGKSVMKTTTYVDSMTGKIGTIGELIDKGVKQFNTWGLNPDTFEIEKVKVVDVLKTGTGIVHRLKLKSGRYIDATVNHKFFSDKGWRQLQYFKEKDFIAIPRVLGNTKNETDLTNDDVYFVGCYLSDGTFRHGRSFCKPSNKRLMLKMEDTANSNNVPTAHISYRGGWKEVSFHSGIEPYFCKLGLEDQSAWRLYSHEKFIPDSIMRLSNKKLKVFVNAMLNTDGWLEVRENNAKNKSPQVSLGYCSTSELMIDQLMIIFQRLGFVARKRTKIPKIKGKEYRKAYEINLYGKQAYELLVMIGSLLGKEKLYDKAINICKGIKWNANVDLVPFTHEDTLAYNRNQNKYKYRDFKRIYDVKKGVFYSRDKLKRLRDDFEDDSLSRLADSDIFWDRVESIEELPGVHDVYDCVVDSHHHNFIANGIVTHNSTRAALISIYQIYLILCLRNPSKYFKLLPSSKITITNVSVSKKQAKDVVFSKIKTLIDYCPWFTQHGYMPDPRSKLELRFDPADSTRINLNKIYKNLYIIPGSSSEFSAVGYDVFCAVIDEATAYGVENDHDKAETIYNTLLGRVSSRFKDTGLIVMAGNPHHVEDFLERRLKEAEGKKDVYTVKTRSVWEAKIPDYDGDYFYFDYGRMKFVDEVEFGKEKVLKVPIIYQAEFESKPELSVRNLAGISLESISRFISNVDRIDDMFIKSGRENPVEILEDGTVKFLPSFKPINKGIHAVHVDIGVTGDPLGMALGHVSGVEKGNYQFYVDCLIRLKGSKSNPNILEDVRSIIYQMSEIGFNIGLVSLDGYQSTDFVQIMKRKGYDSFILSVDKKIGPYINLRQALYEGRINCPFNDFLKHELRTLENVNDKKVEHPLKGSKDVSDGLCGMVNNLIEKVSIEGVTSDDNFYKNKKLVEKKEEKKVRTPEQIFDEKLLEIEEEGLNYGDNC